ncbi:hypothetical protein [Duganella sp. Root336D2]|uniref:hypothetical protein n=1 Tax=Duganella sp. Root336D2 TaxID=1736518 RepID=UPI0006FFA460|nr:hypothetical protein [Duganella sp. Root336D2]KQV44894.1 hypothetical protein ASD07_20345 [Duganella sp. Root336D2]
MQANIYISAEAMATVNAIQHLDYYERISLSDDPATDLTHHPGYYLNTNALHLIGLPEGAKVILSLSPADADRYGRHVSIPTNLRGVIFSGAPNLPVNYDQIISYWSPLSLMPYHRNALYYQNVQSEYCVTLTETDGMGDAGDGLPETVDTLISDSVVVVISGLAASLTNLSSDHFVALTIPINSNMLGIELDGYRSSQDYVTSNSLQSETVFLRIADILASPNPDLIAIAAIRSETDDYGYIY